MYSLENAGLGFRISYPGVLRDIKCHVWICFYGDRVLRFYQILKRSMVSDVKIHKRHIHQICLLSLIFLSFYYVTSPLNFPSPDPQLH